VIQDLMAAPPAIAISGLTESEVIERRARGLGNSPPPPTGRTYGQIIRDNVLTSINITMFMLGALLVLVHRPRDAAVSLLIISLNIVVALVQEIRAKRTLDAIALLTRPHATVIREGQERHLLAEELVVGDVLRVAPGDQIVLDGRVIGDGRITADESLLTGESDAIPKRAGDPVYSGSFCVTGSAFYVAEDAGRDSLANKMTAGARAFRRELTPLQTEINRLVRLVLLIVIYMEFLLVVNAVLKQIGTPETVANATLVVGLVPNGLFLSMSVAYALGAVRILRFGTLVQQSNAIESLSNVDVLCTDKTGTLTTNDLSVEEVHPVEVSKLQMQHILGVMGASTPAGNKTSVAIAQAFPAEAHRPLASVPFSSARKWSALAFDDDDLFGTYALGAPEMLRPYLADGRAGSAALSAIAATTRELAERGLRVLMLAHHPDMAGLQEAAAQAEAGDDEVHLPAGMRPLGLVSLSDKLRPEAQDTLQAFAAAGVKIKIISGDSPDTVAALARQAGLREGLKPVSGLELAGLPEQEFNARAAESVIFGRIAPHQKEQIVHALRESGHYVAMVGDGVNDVLALKHANLGIGMQSGSQAARAVADLVLMNDSFAALPPAVAEGQRIASGLDDMIRLFLTRIFTMMLLILSSLVVGQFPLALRHGSVVTLFSVGIPSLMLAFWARPAPRNRGDLYKRVARFVIPPVLLTSAIGLLLFYGAWMWPALAASGFHLTPAELTALVLTARPVAQTTLAIFTALCGLFLVIFVEPPTDWWAGGEECSGDPRPAILAVVLMIALFITTQVRALRDFFALAPLPLIDYGLILGATVIWLFLVRMMWRTQILERFLG
jgi:cation-transporting P-type ATPase E